MFSEHYTIILYNCTYLLDVISKYGDTTVRSNILKLDQIPGTVCVIIGGSIL